MKKIILLIIFLKIVLVAGCKIRNNNLTITHLPEKTKQLVVVTTKDFDSNQGLLQRYEKKEKWEKIGKEINVFLGKNGLGWGLGICELRQGKNIKLEGDKKAPAGIFELGMAFGYEEEEFKYEYIEVHSNLKCIDDSNSIYYNQILYDNFIEEDYKSFENMRRSDDLYSLGIVVKHNEEAIRRGGSCIFLHVANNKPTLGCTSMDKKELREIIEWLEIEKYPLLIQLPKDIFEGLKVFE